MKSRCCLSVLRFPFIYLWLLGPVFFGSAIGLAQVESGSSPISSSRQQSVKATIVASTGLFAAGDFGSGEHALFLLNLNQPGTSEWHLESSQRLVQMALLLDARDDHHTAQQLALRALAQLDSADTKAGGAAKAMARVLTQRGFIQENFICDAPAALDCYREARRFDPGSARLASEIKRLEHKVAELERKKRR